jgi:DNA-binding NarL/FixJ family response regulator
MKLLLVDDHPLFNAGLAMALRHAHAGMARPARPEPLQVQTATTLHEGLELAASYAPDMVLLDYHLRGSSSSSSSSGAHALQAFAKRFPWIARIVVSGDERAEVASLARMHSASGFISKTSPIDQIWRAVQAIAAGAEWWGPPGPLQPSPDPGPGESDGRFEGGASAASARHSFTLRQLEVLQFLSKGLNNREIANALFISERTVKQHISDMLTKSAVANRVQLLNTVRNLGLLL